jgi:hypothetical protein
MQAKKESVAYESAQGIRPMVMEDLGRLLA